MSRDWANENWRKLYIRQSPADVALCWQARCLRPLLIMWCDRSGLIAVEQGPRRVRLVAGLLNMPQDVVGTGLSDLLVDGCLVELEHGYFMPQFEEAQRSRKSSRQRMKESRERRAFLLRNATDGCEAQRLVADRREEIKTTTAPPAFAAVGAQAAPAPKTVVAAVSEIQEPQFSQTTTATAVSSGAVVSLKGQLKLTRAQKDFLDTWNTWRAEKGRSPEKLTAAMLPKLDAVWSAAERQCPEAPLPAVGKMMVDFLDAKMAPHGNGTNLRTLSTLLNPRVWGERLGDACASIRREADEAVSRRRL